MSCFLRKESLYQVTQSGLIVVKLRLPPDFSRILMPLQQQTTKVVMLAGVMEPDYHARPGWVLHSRGRQGVPEI